MKKQKTDKFNLELDILYADLRRADLSKSGSILDLRNVNLAGANLIGTDLACANLIGIDLACAKIIKER